MKLRLIAGAIVLIIFGTQAFAGVSLISGTGTLVVNQNNQRYTADPYNIDSVFYWPEQSGVTLGSNLVVSILPPASFPTDSTSHSNDNSLVIPSGTKIDSYMLNYDPQSGSTTATFQFDGTILGLITNERDSAANDHFMLSDFLIDPLVPAGNRSAAWYSARGIEPTGGDFIRWLSPTRIQLSLAASSPGDQVRVITATPEPGSFAIVAIGMIALSRRRRVARAQAD